MSDMTNPILIKMNKIQNINKNSLDLLTSFDGGYINHKNNSSNSNTKNLHYFLLVDDEYSGSISTSLSKSRWSLWSYYSLYPPRTQNSAHNDALTASLTWSNCSEYFVAFLYVDSASAFADLSCGRGRRGQVCRSTHTQRAAAVANRPD